MGEDHFRQIEYRSGATAILSVVQEASPFERERITGLMAGQNSEEIESLKFALHALIRLPLGVKNITS